MSMVVHHVVPRSGKWAVRKSGNERATKTFSTQKEAIEFGMKAAKEGQSVLYVHREDGSIRDRRSYLVDKDPRKFAFARRKRRQKATGGRRERTKGVHQLPV